MDACNLQPNQLGYVAGDTLPGLSGAIKDDDGVAVDITGYQITLHIAYPVPVVIPATITDAVNGVYVIDWRDSDLTYGRWRFELQIVDTGGNTVTVNRHSDNNALLELVVDRQVA